MSDALSHIFENLNRWRHLPNYQLERRLDIFLTPFLQRIVEQHLGVELDSVIVPEMPLRQVESNRTDKVDYVMFSRDGVTAFLIELKTDCSSLRREQDEYLDLAREKEWRATLEDLKRVVQATKSRTKYFHLLQTLERAGQMKLHPTLFDCFRDGVAPRFSSALADVTTKVTDVQMVFITPTRPEDGRKSITFAEIARTLADEHDPLATSLCHYLMKWQCEAGSIPPE